MADMEGTAKRRRRRGSIEEVIVKTQQKLEKTKERFLKKNAEQITGLFANITEIAGRDAFEVLREYVNLEQADQQAYLERLILEAAKKIEIDSSLPR